MNTLAVERDVNPAYTAFRHEGQEVLSNPAAALVETPWDVQPLLGLADARGGPRSLVKAVVSGECTDRRSLLLSYIDRVEASLNDGTWCQGESFSEVERKLMVDLVQMANDRKPGLNLVYLESPKTLGAMIKQAMEGAGATRFRYIVNVGTDDTHFAVFDCRILDGHASVILFEPVTLGGLGPQRLAIRAQSAVLMACPLATCHFLTVEMDLQRSVSECGVFSLALGKKLHKEHQALNSLHQLNVQGIFFANPFMLPSEADQYLPPSFYKHVQGRARMAEYLQTRPDAEQVIVNKKQQTLRERVNGHMEAVGGRVISKSAHDKRLAELKALERYLV